MKLIDYVKHIQIHKHKRIYGGTYKLYDLPVYGDFIVSVGYNEYKIFLAYTNNNINSYSSLESNKDIVRQSALMNKYFLRDDILNK